MYDKIEEMFGNPDPEDCWNGKSEPCDIAVKYVVLDNEPDPTLSFNDVCVSAIDTMMSCAYEGVCYSEYTCGVGGFDFLVNQHSLFDELAGHAGKYIWLQI